MPRNGVTASSFILKPDDCRLACKRATESEDSRSLAEGTKNKGHRGEGSRAQGCRNGRHYLWATVAAALLGLGSGFQHGVDVSL